MPRKLVKVRGKDMADKKTGKQAASAASKELKDKKSTPTQKKVAGSDLSQAPSKKKK
jgi:hypothetical protein